MAKCLFNTLEEQSVFDFSGRIDVMESGARKVLGQVFLRDGRLIRACWGDKVEGMKALMSIYVQEIEKGNLYYLEIPEVVDEIAQNIHFPLSVVKKKVSDFYQRYEKSAKLRPPSGIKLLLKGEFLQKNEAVDSNEFRLLCTISEYCLVQEIYQNCSLLDFEITEALVSLRKKGAFSVLRPKSA